MVVWRRREYGYAHCLFFRDATAEKLGSFKKIANAKAMVVSPGDMLAQVVRDRGFEPLTPTVSR